MDLREELKSAGVLPSGPVSAWPRDRNERIQAVMASSMRSNPTASPMESRATKVRASAGRMARGLLKTAGQAVMHGKVSAEIREERYNTCKACPFFVEDSKRCSDCGCFMEAKTWVGGDPNLLCPQKKWSR